MPPRFQLDEDEDALHGGAAFRKAPESAYGAVYSPVRLYLRRLVVEQVARETPVLAEIQRRYRTPALDRLFVFTGMLGNHTFFMVALPFLHLFGMGLFARGLTFVVLWSVYFSGVIKDYVSAPRPASPPVVQITRSPAHTLEYGFPSSHTTYVVATILYLSHYMLNVWGVSALWVALLWIGGALIVVGRIYCGLHSFIDVAGGVVVGVAEALAFVVFYERLDALLLSTTGPLVIAAILYCALMAIPRSLDLCPCCIDSFCATSVTLGVSVGTWIHACMPFLWHRGHPDRIAWDSSLTLAQNVARGAIGMGLVVLWKLKSKPVMISLVKRLFPGDQAHLEDRHAAHAQDASDAVSQAGYPIPSAACIKGGRYGSYAIMAAHENLARIPIYSGIPLTMYVVSPIAFYFLGLMPR
ncbi:Long-chain base-1-phosphate phosphatase [Coemansia javaensis]|uniref:Long-chain base-1-phosphate phosphatase n=1 Tax=Coemansia javaensis TaxID=2761396 RepID=A0A9W8LIR1_9FUNG|nr:Long-chain base-1-phosphate phosphatase [Coemansia javaensis]